MFPAPNHENAFDMLEAGRADYLLVYRGPLTRVLESKENYDIRYTSLSSLDLFLVMRKDYPRVTELMKHLEEIVGSIPKDALGNPCSICVETKVRTSD